jgi:hypothetical protein
VWAYERTLGDGATGDRAVVVLNFEDEPVAFDPDGLGVAGEAYLVGTYDDPPARATSTLRPYEARVYLD